MPDSKQLRALCQRCGAFREAVNRETEWTCRECHLEQQGQRLLALVEARGKELAEARRGQEEAREVARFYFRLVETGQATLVLPGRRGLPEWLLEAP